VKKNMKKAYTISVMCLLLLSSVMAYDITASTPVRIDTQEPIPILRENTNFWHNPITCKGDMTRDGVISFADINPFVDCLNHPVPRCRWTADINGDLRVNNFDINPFVALMGKRCAKD
jgi:hypothetical protein